MFKSASFSFWVACPTAWRASHTCNCASCVDSLDCFWHSSASLSSCFAFSSVQVSLRWGISISFIKNVRSWSNAWSYYGYEKWGQTWRAPTWQKVGQWALYRSRSAIGSDIETESGKEWLTLYRSGMCKMVGEFNKGFITSSHAVQSVTVTTSTGSLSVWFDEIH